MSETFTVEALDGWRLAVDYHPPEPGVPTRGALWMGHAMMANRRSLDRPEGEGLASTLAAAGYHVYKADLRGHGESGPLAAESGRWRYDDIVLQDIPALSAWVKKRHPDLPLVVVGHSLVGHGTLASLGQVTGQPVDAVVSIASNAWVRPLERSRLRWIKKRAALVPFVGLSRVYGYFPARRFKLGSEDEARAYVEQFAQWARTGRWGSADGIRDYLAGLGAVTQPVLAISGAGDTLLCPPRDCRAFHARLKNAPVTYWEVSRSSRFGYDANHMSLVTNSKCAPLWREIARWMNETLAAGRAA